MSLHLRRIDPDCEIQRHHLSPHRFRHSWARWSSTLRQRARTSWERFCSAFRPGICRRSSAAASSLRLQGRDRRQSLLQLRPLVCLLVGQWQGCWRDADQRGIR